MSVKTSRRPTKMNGIARSFQFSSVAYSKLADWKNEPYFFLNSSVKNSNFILGKKIKKKMIRPLVKSTKKRDKMLEN